MSDSRRPIRLNPLLRVGLYLVAYFAALMAVQTPVGVIWIALHMARGASLDGLVEEAQRSMLSLTWLLPLAVLQLLAVIGLTYVFRRFIDRQSFLGLGLQPDRNWLAETGVGVALGVVAMSVVFMFQAATGLVTVGFAPVSAPILLLRIAGYTVLYLAVALAEELMFRGYVLRSLEEWPGPVVAVVGSAAIFAVLHGLNPGINLLALFHLALAGLVFAYACMVTGRLWLPIGLHFAWNFFQGPIFGFPVSGVPPEGLLALTPRAGAWWVTGGGFGPEGGLVGLLGLSLCALGIWLYARRYKPPRVPVA